MLSNLIQGDQIASLYDLLTFSDKPISDTAAVDQAAGSVPAGSSYIYQIN